MAMEEDGNKTNGGAGEQPASSVTRQVVAAKKSGAALYAFAGLCTAAVIALGVVLFYPVSKSAICYGVSVAGIPVQGMTRAEALLAVSGAKSMTPPEYLYINAGGKSFKTKLSEIDYMVDVVSAVNKAYSVGRGQGAAGNVAMRVYAAASHPDIPVTSKYNLKKLDKLVHEIETRVERKPVDALIDWIQIKIIPHKDGLGFDKKATAAKIATALTLYDGKPVELDLVTTHPRTTVKDLSDIDLKTPLATFSTKFSEGMVNRSKNLRKISEILTGYEVKPGETFSYNDVVGNRTKEAGFYLAPEIVNGKMQPGYGGGACQGSTTLFNTALFAGMEDFVWSPHSQQSHYANPGRDAAVYYGQIDMKFRNPHKKSVFLRAVAEKGVLTVSMYSSFKLPYKVELSSKWWGRFFPGETVTLNPELPPGKRVVISKGASGLYATLYRTFVYPDGKKVEKVMKRGKSTELRYPGAKRIVETGPEAEEPETQAANGRKQS